MIIQSHLPNIVHLLPSIPQNFSLSGPPVHYTHLTQVLGRIRRWPSRGGLYVSMDWKLGIIEYVLLEIEKSHPWFSSHIVEKRKGYLDISNSTNYYVSLISPNKLTVRSPSTCFFVNKVGNSRVSIIRKEEDHVLQFRFTSFPCHICLCSNQERCSCLDEQ